MTKAEILKDKNIPQFIKEIVANAPEDADIEICAVKSDRKPTAKEDSCKCEDVSYPDGVDISAYMSSIGDTACSLLDMTDSKARLRKEDVAKALGYVDCISGTVSQLYNYLVSYDECSK